MAGIKKIKIHGDKRKKEDKSAKPLSKILKSPLNNQRKRPFKTKKTAMTKYPMGEAKKLLISFFSMASIYFIKS
jgi:hypothetical protein